MDKRPDPENEPDRGQQKWQSIGLDCHDVENSNFGGLTVEGAVPQRYTLMAFALNFRTRSRNARECDSGNLMQGQSVCYTKNVERYGRSRAQKRCPFSNDAHVDTSRAIMEFYSIYSAALIVFNVALAYHRYQQSSSSTIDEKEEETLALPKDEVSKQNVKSFKTMYFGVYILAMAADWLQVTTNPKHFDVHILSSA